MEEQSWRLEMKVFKCRNSPSLFHRIIVPWDLIRCSTEKVLHRLISLEIFKRKK